MYEILMYMNTIMFFCMAVSFTYGVVRFFKKGKALYLQMIVCGIGCMMLSRAYHVITLLTTGVLTEGFHVGRLGIMGSFLFFLCANYGQVDKLLDDGAKENRKYRIIPLVAPILIWLGYQMVLFGVTTVENKVVCGVTAALIMFASYFNLKHLIFPDVEFGFIRNIRNYNLIALILAVLSIGEMIFLILEWIVPLVILYIMMCVVSLTMIPVLERGVKKWTI